MIACKHVIAAKAGISPRRTVSFSKPQILLAGRGVAAGLHEVPAFAGLTVR